MDELPEIAYVIEKLNEEFEQENNISETILRSLKRTTLKELTKKFKPDDTNRFKQLKRPYLGFYLGNYDIDGDEWNYRYDEKYYEDLDYLLYDCHKSIEVLGEHTIFKYSLKEGKKPKIIDFDLFPGRKIEFNYGTEFHNQLENEWIQEFKI